MVLYASGDKEVGHFSLWIDKLALRVSMDSAREAPQLITFFKLGFTNANHCLMIPSMSRPRSRTSRRTRSMSEHGQLHHACVWNNNTLRLERQVSASASQKIFGVMSVLGSVNDLGRDPVYLHVHQLQDPWIIQSKNTLDD